MQEYGSASVCFAEGDASRATRKITFSGGSSRRERGAHYLSSNYHVQVMKDAYTDSS